MSDSAVNVYITTVGKYEFAIISIQFFFFFFFFLVGNIGAEYFPLIYIRLYVLTIR